MPCPTHCSKKTLLTEERICLVAAEVLLERCLPEWMPQRTTLTPKELERLPMTSNPEVSTVKQVVEGFLVAHDIALQNICMIGDYRTQLSMCMLGESAFFCPESFLLDDGFIGQNGLRILTVEGLASRVRVELITHKSHYLPEYVGSFCRLLEREYRSRVEALREKL